MQPAVRRRRDERQHSASLLFGQIVPDQCDDGVQRFRLVGAVGFEHDTAPLDRRQHHHAHQALGVDPAAVSRQRHVALVLRGEAGELGTRRRVQPPLVDDLNLALLRNLDSPNGFSAVGERLMDRRRFRRDDIERGLDPHWLR
jgi:hypothetical protein